jgi:hypothetical protein
VALYFNIAGKQDGLQKLNRVRIFEELKNSHTLDSRFNCIRFQFLVTTFTCIMDAHDYLPIAPFHGYALVAHVHRL